MYFLYFVILCSISTLLTPANSYVVLAANLNDFRSIAKKFVPNELVNQIKALVVETGNKDNEEAFKYEEQADRTVESEEDIKNNENAYELETEFKAALAKQYVNTYKKNKAPKAAIIEPLESQTVKQLATPTAKILTLDDIVHKVKEKLLTDLLKGGNAKGNVAESAKLKAKPRYNSIPMKILKEEVQFEATYEDTDDKPQPQYYSHYYNPIPLKIPGKNSSPKKNPYYGAKKVRFVKQILVPAANQKESVYLSQPNLNLEPQLSLQRLNIEQKLAEIQQQIDQLKKTVEDTHSKKKPALQTPHLNIEAIDAHFHILPHQSVNNDSKTNDSQEGQIELVLSGETTAEAKVTEPSTKGLTIPGKVENEQFGEEDTAIISEDEAAENKSKEKTGKKINEKERSQADEHTKVHTQEFGKTDVGEPIVEKTYNFNAPVKEPERLPTNMNVPAGSARKVMLF